MAYEPDKDKQLWMKKDEHTGISVAIMQYNGGEKKIAVRKTFEQRDGKMKTVNAGRLNVKEAVFVARTMGDVVRMLNEG